MNIVEDLSKRNLKYTEDFKGNLQNMITMEVYER